jgi:hypothetical protein
MGRLGYGHADDIATKPMGFRSVAARHRIVSPVLAATAFEHREGRRRADVLRPGDVRSVPRSTAETLCPHSHEGGIAWALAGYSNQRDLESERDREMKRLGIALRAALLAVSLTGALSYAAATGTTTVESVPLALTAFVPCANGGLGENVQLSGWLQIVDLVTFDAAGGIHLYSHFNPQRVSGTGLVSGATYRGTGVTVSVLNLSPGVEQVMVNNFLLVGTGHTPSLRVQGNLVFVVDANGNVSAVVDNIRLSCN